MSSAEASSRFRRDDVGRNVSFAARLPPDPAAVAAARRMVRKRLGEIVAPATLENVLIVVSELVTNAVRHGCGEVELAIALDEGRLTGRVCDEGDGFEHRMPEPADARIGGHGLQLVAQVADGWGVRERSAQVWFEIADERAAAPAQMA